MGHKHYHKKKKYFSVTDRPIFKILGALVMIPTYAFLYYFVVHLLEKPGLALTCIVPCALMLIWVAIKQRYFWWIWLVGACPCVVLMIMFRQPPLSIMLETAYWLMGFGMCMWLIFAPSRARSRANKRKKARQNQQSYTNEAAEPRPKDEFLEKLFGEAE